MKGDEKSQQLENLQAKQAQTLEGIKNLLQHIGQLLGVTAESLERSHDQHNHPLCCTACIRQRLKLQGEKPN